MGKNIGDYGVIRIWNCKGICVSERVGEGVKE
jgi:hypothetical protein